jgi:peptidoglycan/LPS O-acetylase OafA/YrhL
LLLKELAEHRFRFRTFYARRIKRIFPALLAALFLTWTIGWLALLPSEFANLGKHIVGGCTFTSNFLLWSETGYFNAEAEQKPLLHLWSLGIEEQFYIFFPLVLWLALRIGKELPR